MCQFKYIHEMAEEESLYVSCVEAVRRALSKMKKSLRLMQSQVAGNGKNPPSPAPEAGNVPLNPGDLVRVRSREEIDGMLDFRGTYQGCPFIEGMYVHCNGTYKVLKKASYFYDELKGKLCKCKNLVVLENTICYGKQKLYATKCDLLCLFFWHQGWLEKVENEQE